MTELDYEAVLESIDFEPAVQASENEKPFGWSDDNTKGTWQDTFTARKRVFPDGQCVVTVTKDKFFVGPAQTRQKAKRGESENREASEEFAGRRARQKVSERCKTIGADRIVTLTYRENMTDRELALKHFKAFCRRVGKVNAFHYVAVIEEQDRGSLHFHVAVHGRQNYLLLRSIWQRVLGRGENGEQMGQVNVSNPNRFGFGKNGAHRLAAYISKYCGKEMALRDLNQKRYFCSRGIVVPEVQSWRLPNCTCMLDAARAAFRFIEGHTMDGLITWCNNPLGVVYLATAPGLPVEPDCPF
ncbi:rolling circle replication-associated protein [Pseudoduganella sp. R-34]|uniref:rolling circle replication-associated protein n=1 Tax=Pseudoduganella sp. R-34 TaxID=3404062 RepID=UPI003CF8C18F